MHRHMHIRLLFAFDFFQNKVAAMKVLGSANKGHMKKRKVNIIITNSEMAFAQRKYLKRSYSY